ncbi:ribonuclease P protein subunit p29 [Halyomorpha halys]|uniref:ribonuclease P protein subunit p29 n=1 Tax=Halyomorpha halys TaxID=286706 RepID=UPI0006D4CC10|nr:ribonuclease P protein subunit p29 [Halyomorpha halys]
MAPPVISDVEVQFLQKLPDPVLEKTIGFKEKVIDDEVEKSFLKSRLPLNDVEEIEKTINKRYNFTSVQAVFKKRVRRKGCARNTGLSSSKKRLLGLNNISKKGLNYDDLLPLHHCWNEYISNLIDLPYLKKQGWRGEVSSSIHEEFSQLLWKADYHGAYITIVKSTCPSLVGIEGILVFETKNVLKILGKDNITRSVPKASCEFKITIGDYQVKFLGKHFMIKPTDRAVKKVKAGKYFSL